MHTVRSILSRAWLRGILSRSSSMPDGHSRTRILRNARRTPAVELLEQRLLLTVELASVTPMSPLIAGELPSMNPGDQCRRPVRRVSEPSE